MIVKSIATLTGMALLLALIACEERPTPSSAADLHRSEITPPPEVEQTAAPMSDPQSRTEAEWRAMLTPEQYRVLREKGTERAFTGEFDEYFEAGEYACAACDQVLFNSETKFNSGCGWPAFYAAKAGDRVRLISDRSHGMVRTEVVCSRCDSHLGHVFDDAPKTPTGQRFCINSVSLKFTPAKH